MHRGSSLVNLLELMRDDVDDPECREHVARRANREGLKDATDVKRAMSAALAKKIGELSAVLAELNVNE